MEAPVPSGKNHRGCPVSIIADVTKEYFSTAQNVAFCTAAVRLENHLLDDHKDHRAGGKAERIGQQVTTQQKRSRADDAGHRFDGY
jgi:hypothetical protein